MGRQSVSPMIEMLHKQLGGRMYDEAGIYSNDTNTELGRGLDSEQNIYTGMGFMDRSKGIDQVFGETSLRSTQALQNEQTAEVGAQKDRAAVLPERSRINNEGQAGNGLFFNAKNQQLDIINNCNPPNDDYHTWIRSVDDILTLEEAINDSDFAGEDSFTPDYTREMAEEAIRSGKITVYNINRILPRNKKSTTDVTGSSAYTGGAQKVSGTSTERISQNAGENNAEIGTNLGELFEQAGINKKALASTTKKQIA